MLNVLILIVSAALGVGALATWVFARRNGWRWGSTPGGTVELADGPYRAAQISTTVPRGIPPSVASASITSIAWGLFTLCVFSPAGLLMASFPERTPLYLIYCLILCSLHGFVIGARLCAVSRSLSVRTGRSAEKVRSVAVHSLIHHAGVFLVFLGQFLVVFLPRGVGDAIFWLAAPLCLLGAVQAGSILSAARTIAALDDLDAVRRESAAETGPGRWRADV
jgi:hypothetical protein